MYHSAVEFSDLTAGCYANHRFNLIHTINSDTLSFSAVTAHPAVLYSLLVIAFIFCSDPLYFSSCHIAISGPTEQHQKLVKEGDDALLEQQDSHVSAQSRVPEADEASSSAETSEEQQARCSTTERQSAGTQSGGVRVGRTHKLSQYAKLKEQEESTTKDLMEYQDDLSDADYTPSQSVLSVSCFAQLG